MKPVEDYHEVPHKKPCDCLTCRLLRKVQRDAYDDCIENWRDIEDRIHPCQHEYSRTFPGHGGECIKVESKSCLKCYAPRPE